MKHLIILNGRAGEGTAINHVNEIEKAFKNLDAEIHYTSAPGEATTFLRSYLANETNHVRVYACGGDGTLNECLNGIVGHDNVELAVYAIGTGNDFVKIYGGKERFMNLENIINGTIEKVDISKIEAPTLETPLYSINAINVGFDAYVGHYGNIYKEKGKKDPYDKGLVPAIFKNRFNKIQITVDGERITKKKMLMCNFCHGQYIGGKFKTAPRSVNTDGLLEVCLVNCVSLFTFLNVLGPFTKGEHLDSPKFSKYFTYRRATEIEIESKKDTVLCIDGEIIQGSKFLIKVLPAAINFVVPKGE